MSDAAVLLAALAFAAMGVVAIAVPTRVTRQFNMPDLNAVGRSEVRAAYGGFGIAIAAALVAALLHPDLREGVCLTVAAALLGMVVGRIASAAVDRAIGRFPLTYLVIEAAGAALLVYAA